MATIKLRGNKIETTGNLPTKDSKAPDFKLIAADLSTKSLKDYNGKRKILNIFPSVDTGVCAESARKFNEKATSLKNTTVLCISKDLPFAQSRFCAAEGLENVAMLSDFKTGDFGRDYGLTIKEGAFEGLHSRVVIVLDENNKIIHEEQVPDIGQEPNYETALNALK